MQSTHHHLTSLCLLSVPALYMYVTCAMTTSLPLPFNCMYVVPMELLEVCSHVIMFCLIIMAEYKLLRRSALLLVPVHVQFVCCIATCPYPVASKFDWLLCSNITIHTDVIVITSCTYDVMLVTSSLRHHYIIITSSNPGPTRRHGGHAGAGW